jgi:tRNA-binding protein
MRKTQFSQEPIMNVRFIEIPEDGKSNTTYPLDDMLRSFGDAMRTVYQSTGFVRPWIGYLAELDGKFVGTCGYKFPPRNGQVEIAYFTLPGFEGRGIATQMARQLIDLGRKADSSILITAQTLPENNASTSILRKLGFSRTGWADDHEVGRVWEWTLPKFASVTDFEKLDIRVGRIVAVEPFPEGRYSTHILMIDFGSPLGRRKSLAKLAPNYNGPELIGSQVLAVVNFPPRQIGQHQSQALTLGVPDDQGNVVVLRPDTNVPIGGRVF